MKIIVASKNPVKINTAYEGFIKMFPDIVFEIEGISAESNVADQPMSEEKTLQGALNRAENASKINSKTHYLVIIKNRL